MPPPHKAAIASLIADALATAPVAQAAKPGDADSGDKAAKAEQQQKALGKGSEQGQESHEAHRRKWWRFWE